MRKINSHFLFLSGLKSPTSRSLLPSSPQWRKMGDTRLPPTMHSAGHPSLLSTELETPRDMNADSKFSPLQVMIIKKSIISKKTDRIPVQQQRTKVAFIIFHNIFYKMPPRPSPRIRTTSLFSTQLSE